MKKIQKILFSVLALMLVLQTTSTGIFANNEAEVDPVVEVVEEKQEEQHDVLPEEDEVVERSSKNVEFEELAISFVGVEGSSSQNAKIKTGTKAIGTVSVGIGGSQNVEVDELALRITVPKNKNFTVGESIEYDTKFGSINSPFEEPVEGSSFDYVWLIFKVKIEVGGARTVSVRMDPFDVGIPADETLDISVDAFFNDNQEITSLNKNAKATVHSYANLFGYNNVSSGYSYRVQNVTNQTGDTLYNYVLTQSTSSQYSANTSGLVYTSKIIFTNTYKMDLDLNDEPFIKLTRNDIVKSNGDQFSPGELSVKTSSKGYVTEFTVVTEAVAQAGTQLNNATAGFILKAPKYDADAIQSQYNLPPKATKNMRIRNVSSSAQAYAVGKISDRTETSIQIPVNTMYDFEMNYTNGDETGEETANQPVAKRITKIANINTTNSDLDKLGAYQNDIVTFDFGGGWKNLQKNPINTVTFTEFVDRTDGVGYQSSELRPLRLMSGVHRKTGGTLSTTGLEIYITYSDTGRELAKTITASDLDKSQTYNIEADRQDKVTKIEYVYTNVEPNFYIFTGPSIDYRVIEQMDPTTQGKKFSNSVQLDYTYDSSVVSKVSNEVYFRYRDVNADKAGVYGSSKSGLNLAGHNFQEENDVYQFTIDISNKKNDAVKIKSIKDYYTYNLSAYDGDRSVNGDPTSKAIDPKYLSVEEANILYWNESESVNNPAVDQDVFETITVTDATSKSESGLIDITFKDDGINLDPGETIHITYTLYVNDKYEPETTISNRFDSFDKEDKEIVSGSWSSSKDIDHPIEKENNYGKSGDNLSGITLSELPYTSDIVVYTLKISNTKDYDLENITIEDHYTDNLKPYNSINHIKPEHIASYGFKTDNEANMNLSIRKDGDGDLIAPAGFDFDELTLTQDEANQSFTIDLGSNVLKPSEELNLIYTMQVTRDVVPGSAIINTYRVFADGEYELSGRHAWNLNKQANANGVVSLVHNVEGIEIGGVKPVISGLLDGELLEFGIVLSNYLPRADRIVNVKNVFAYIPDYVVYVPNTVKVEARVSTPNGTGGYDEVLVEIPDTDYTVEYDDSEGNNTLKVRFNDDYELPGGIEGTDFNKSTHSIEISYTGEVASEDPRFTPIPSNVFNSTVKSTAVAFYKEDKDTLVSKAGSVNEKKPTSPYQDEDDTTQSYLQNNSSNLSILNERNAFGYISKAVKSEDYNIDLMTRENPGRTYTVSIYNTAFRDFNVTHLVDLLPTYETLDETKPILIKMTTPEETPEEFEAVYKTDKVTLNDVEYSRITITGYMKDGVEEPINMKAIKKSGDYTSWDLTYSTVIDAQTAKNDLYVVDKYTEKYTNRVAMYTDQEITLARPRVSTTTATVDSNDNIDDNDWDSNIDTKTRYQTSVPVQSTLSSIAPFIGAKSQFIQVTDGGLVYRDATPTDFIDPGAIVAWRMTIGNSNVSNTPEIKAGSIVAIELPDGLEFNGYRDDVLPDFLEEVEVSPTSRVLIWKTTRDITNDGVENVFTIRTDTRPSFYDTYTIKGYFVPVEVGEFGFINSKIKATSQFRKFSYQPNTDVLPEELGFGTEMLPHVYTSESINVLGNTAIGGHMSVQSITNSSENANTGTAPYFTTLSDVEDVVKYTMLFEVYKPGSGIQEVTFINRLGGDNDKFVNRDQYRRSQGKVKLEGDGSFEVTKVNATTGSIIEAIDPSDYTVQYAVVDYDYTFTPNDWNASNNDIWMDETELLANGYDFEDVTATRTVISNDVDLEMNQAVKVTYLAHLEEYYMENWQVNNSFAYSARVDGSINMTIETRDVGLKAKVNTDRLEITTEVIDPALVPLQTEFEFDVIGYNKDTGEEEMRITKVIDVTEVSEGILKNIVGVEELSRNMTYKVEPKSYIGFRVPTVEITSSTDNFGLTSWKAHVTYERIVYDEVLVDVEVKTINDKRPVSAIGYTIEKTGVARTTDSEYRIVDIAANVGQDSITTFETGSKYSVVADAVEFYTVEVIQLDTEELDTTGYKDHFKIVYTQEEEIDPDKDKDKDKDKDGINTGIENNALLYIGILAGAAVVAAIVFFTKKSKEK